MDHLSKVRAVVLSGDQRQLHPPSAASFSMPHESEFGDQATISLMDRAIAQGFPDHVLNIYNIALIHLWKYFPIFVREVARSRATRQRNIISCW